MCFAHTSWDQYQEDENLWEDDSDDFRCLDLRLLPT